MIRPRRQGVFFGGLILFVLLSLLFGCAKKKQHQQDSFSLSPSISPGGEGAAALYPHSEGWEGAGSHGVSVNQRGTADCLLCHHLDPDTISPAPSCHSCHPLFPHQEDWVSKDKHGNVVLSEGKKPCGTLCHGSGFEGGLSQVSCNQCHAIFPHASNWPEGSSHGASARGEGKKLCQSCHGEDLRGGKSKISCYQCHEIYPHEPEWALPAKHGNFVSSGGKAVCATSCHGNDLKGGGSRVSCDQCHQLYPHPADWERGHRQVARDVGLESCARCHGADFKKEIGGKNCYSCHADYPHPARERWVPFQGGHGEKIKVDYSGKFDSCQGCHGEDLSRRINDENCSSCHPAYPIAHRQENWRVYEGHGAVTPSVYPYADCQLCHGAEYEGLRGNRSCYDCHNRFPHRSGWRRERGESQDHGEYVRNFSSTGCATSHCHGENLIPTEVTRGANCRRCHEGYPHPEMLEWRRPTRHGVDVLSNGLVDSQGNPRCLQCHDRERGGPYGARSCQNAGCHSVYPHEMMEDWEENHGREAVGRETRILRCGGCHSSDFRRALGGVNCYSCHINFPHPQDLPGGGCPLDSEGNPQCWTRTWITEREVCEETCTDEEWCDGEVSCWTVSDEHVSPHAEQYLEQQDSDFAPPDPTHPEQFNQCRRCHGEDYQGGASGIACSSCHRGYPHRTNNNWRTTGGGDHTQSYLEGVRGTSSPCALCHRSLRGGIEGRATSCAAASCHIDYPHTDPNWTAPGRASGHATRIISARSTASCRVCHGDDLSRVVGEVGGHEGTSCLECHPQGPAIHESQPGRLWYTASGHGNFFASRYQAISINSDCRNCHGSTVAFLNTDTRTSLWDRSRIGCENCSYSCYACHWAYPHVATADGGGNEYPWEPVNTSSCGERNFNNATGHVVYLMSSPLFTDATGNRPPGRIPPIGDPAGAVWINAINHTCGGEGGSCHDAGNRSYRVESGWVLCGGVCHNSGRPYPPELPDCDPPGSDQIVGGAPTVDPSLTVPLNGATGVALGTTDSPTRIEVHFSEAMQRGTIAPPAENSFILEKVADGSRVAGRVICSSDWCFTATFRPEAPLQQNTQYRGRITTAVTDWGGTPLATEYSWIFTTLTPDTTRPTVVSTDPVNGAIAVLTTITRITVNFSESMTRSSVDSPGVFTLSRRSWNGRRRQWEWVSVSGSSRCRTSTCQTVDFTIASSARPLRTDTVYQAAVTTNPIDLSGNHLATGFSWQFTTEGLF